MLATRLGIWIARSWVILRVSGDTLKSRYVVCGRGFLCVVLIGITVPLYSKNDGDLRFATVKDPVSNKISRFWNGWGNAMVVASWRLDDICGSGERLRVHGDRGISRKRVWGFFSGVNWCLVS